MKQEYGPKSGEYQKKTDLIQQLAQASTQQLGETIFALGAQFAESDRVSNKQAEMLVDSLGSAGVLTYVVDFVHSDADPQTVDGALWDVQLDGKLQVRACAVLFSASMTHDDQSRMELLNQLLNQAHMAGFKKIDQADQLKSPVWQNPLATVPELVDDESSLQPYLIRIKSTNDFVKRFLLLQEVMYMGFVMGLRDKRKALLTGW
jgi:hypothetical protein